MRRHGFYEDYQQEKERRGKPAFVSHGGTAATRLFKKLAAAVLYLFAVFLSGVGLVTLIDAPMRDMLIKLVTRLVSGG